MTRHLVSTICFVLGVVLLGAGLLFPVYLKSTDSELLAAKGRSTPSLIAAAVTLLDSGQTGAARKMAQAAILLELPESDRLAAHVQARSQLVSASAVLQGDEKIAVQLFESSPSLPVMDHLLRKSTRDQAMRWLEGSGRSVVQKILETRSEKNFAEFSPAQSAAGQPLEAVIALAGMLAQTDHLSPLLQEQFEQAMVQSETNAAPLEAVYMDLLVLGQRLSWNEFSSLGRKIESTAVLHSLAEASVTHEKEFPIIYSAIFLSENAGGVTGYLAKFPTNAVASISFAMRQRTGAVRELIKKNQAVHHASWRRPLVEYNPAGAIFDHALNFATRSPRGALGLKWFLFLTGGWLVARGIAGWALSPDGSTSKFWLFPGQTAALTASLLAVMVLVHEPMPMNATAKKEVPFKLQIPASAGPFLNSVKKQTQMTMNATALIPLVIFFVLQALIYIWCLSKLAEIKREAVEPRIKLRLLDNEEHLFDAGLYLGFGGTVVSLIMVSMGIITQGIMSAYGSTSFGIIFVTILKIFHIRPYRRQLIYQSEDLQQKP